MKMMMRPSRMFLIAVPLESEAFCPVPYYFGIKGHLCSVSIVRTAHLCKLCILSFAALAAPNSQAIQQKQGAMVFH